MSKLLRAAVLAMTALGGGSTMAQATLGTNVVGLRISDVDGVVHRLGVGNGRRAVVLVFLDEGCPVARRYAPDLNGVAREAERVGVEFYGVISDPDVTARAARAFRKARSLKYPVLFDASGDLAMRVRPTTVPEAFLIDEEDRVAYRGRIDDRFASVGRLRRKITHHDLRDAIAAIGRGTVPAVRRTKPVGCVFEAWTAAIPKAVTYTRNIAPILAANCTECHRQGGIGPFPLETYRQARRRARMIARVCEEKLMPPWRAESGFGHFRDERALSPRQIALLEAWADAGAPPGPPEEALPREKPTSAQWRLGPPDLILTMAEPFEIPATGDDIYRYFVLPEKLPDDVVITAMDFLPGDPTVVHHMNSFVDYTGKARKKDAEDAAPGFSVFGKGSFFDYSGEGGGTGALGGWAPGSDPYRLPPEHGIYVPKGGEVVIEVHYHLTGKKTKDRSSIGFYFAQKPVQHYVDGLVIGTMDVSIPADDGDYVRHVWMNVPADLRLIDVTPHMHNVGKSMKAVVTRPDGTQMPLISIPDWDFRWQNIYTFRKPVLIPKGSRIDAWFHFDNSAKNPDNPHAPPRKLKWGWGTDEEMAELWMAFVPVRRSDSRAIHRAGEATWYRSAKPSREEPGR